MRRAFPPRSHPALLALFSVLVGACADGGVGPGAATDAGTDAATEACASGALCDGERGLCSPIPACSPSAPCVGHDGETIDRVLPQLQCRTENTKRPAFDDGPAMEWTDSRSGEPRAACAFRPSPSEPLPLVIYFHGGGGLASDIYNATSLRTKADPTNTEAFGLADDGRVGFSLVATQGRNLNWPTGQPNHFPGTSHDYYYRDFEPPSESPDVRNADALIDELVAEGGVDRRRIYIMAWSNGGWFAQAYAIARHETPTPGGNRVAAVAIFSSGDPYRDFTETQSPSCAASRRPTTELPLMMVHRTCDVNGCDEAQRALTGQPPGGNVTQWLHTLRTEMRDPHVAEVLIDAFGVERTTCTPIGPCTTDVAWINHVRWPDGVSDKSGRDWELEMLAFLRDHPLP